ncbi:MOSC domain protein [compost metagenome]
MGEVELVVRAPRQPCYKLNAILGYAHAVRDMVRSGYSGVYLSVATPGVIRAGDAAVVIPGPREVSVENINRPPNP